MTDDGEPDGNGLESQNETVRGDGREMEIHNGEIVKGETSRAKEER